MLRLQFDQEGLFPAVLQVKALCHPVIVQDDDDKEQVANQHADIDSEAIPVPVPDKPTQEREQDKLEDDYPPGEMQLTEYPAGYGIAFSVVKIRFQH